MDKTIIGEQFTNLNYRGYTIYPQDGKIWSNKSNRYVGYENEDGYIKCSLYGDDGKRTFTSVHRFIYNALYGIPTGFEINHKDEDTHNNKISNLELVTRTYNNNYGSHIANIQKTLGNREGKNRPIAAYKDGKLVMTFPSLAEAQRQGYGSERSISKCCYGKYHTHRGYNWRFIEKN